MRALLAFVLGVAVGAFAVYFFAPVPAPQPVAREEPRCPEPPTCPTPTPAPPSAPEPSASPDSEPALPPAATPSPSTALPPASAPQPTPSPQPPATPPGPTTPVPSYQAPSGTPLQIPVAGVVASQLVDTYTQARGAGRSHDAIDIMAPTGTPVMAVEDGRIAKLFNSKPGGLTIYEFDRSETYAYYYAHLSGYAPGIVEGRTVKRGELIGYVGSTGNADAAAPHLHFAVFVLGPQKRWWEGEAINPYPLLGGK